MDKKILPNLTTAQLILFIVILNSILLGYLASDINFNRQVSKSNQQNILNLVNETSELLEKQGNFSNAQRAILINQFIHIAQHGGFATKDTQNHMMDMIKNLTAQTNATKLVNR